MRDPLAEFAERYVALLLGGTLAESRVQPGWDLVDPAGRLIQARYVANPAGAWVNEHTVRFVDDVDRYALVVFDDFEITAVVVFDRSTLEQVGAALGKRHPRQDVELQLTRRNLHQILTDRDRFAGLDVDVHSPVPGACRGSRRRPGRRSERLVTLGFERGPAQAPETPVRGLRRRDSAVAAAIPESRPSYAAARSPSPVRRPDRTRAQPMAKLTRAAMRLPARRSHGRGTR